MVQNQKVKQTPLSYSENNKRTKAKFFLIMWQFELDAPESKVSTEQDRQSDAMTYTLTFGKHKGESFAAVMRTDTGRKYLRWLQLQPCTNTEFADAHKKRSERIDTCFEIFEAFKKSVNQ